MTGPIAQSVSLTCYSNAFLHGDRTPQFFPANSTCQFCESIRFVEFRKTLIGDVQELIVADNPDQWIASLHDRRALATRLLRTPENRPGAPDRMLAGFIGGGGQWTLELLCGNGESEFWVSRWELGNREAPDRRIWRVKYGLVGKGPTKSNTQRSLEIVREEFRASLEAIKSFAESYGQDHFTPCFVSALKVLDNPDLDVGYHKDLAIPGQLAPGAVSLLKAAMRAWVFGGGMGSWNDIGFTGNAQVQYERVSEGLFSILNEAIEVAASSSMNTQLSADN
jgi:hypothetical protein